MEFFQACVKGESFCEAITRFRASGMTMKLARTATGRILMLTKLLMRHVEVQKFDIVGEEEACVEECSILYDCLYNRIGNFNADYRDMSVEDKLDIMEGFIRVTPMVFLCNCRDSYSNHECEHSGVLSMLWNPDMKLHGLSS
jgi:hypothetical protein